MKPRPARIEGVLFDLDGTLLDSAPDLYAALVRQCAEEGVAAPDYATVREVVSRGSRAILRCAFADRGEPAIEALVHDLAAMLKPGARLFMSTLNRTPVAFGAAILGAEYLMRLLPRGTHHYAQFLKPSELARLLRHAGLELEDVSGLAYNPLNRKAWLSRITAVNYVLSARKPA